MGRRSDIKLITFLGLVDFSILLFLLILLILEYNGKKKGRKSSIIIPKA